MEAACLRGRRFLADEAGAEAVRQDVFPDGRTSDVSADERLASIDEHDISRRVASGRDDELVTVM
jgi:hypothetical protein